MLALASGFGLGQGALAADDRASIQQVRLGFDNAYKVGYWTPVWAEIEVPAQVNGGRVEVSTPDSDGVMTTASTPLRAQNGDGPGTVLVYTRPGRVHGPITISLVSGDRVLDARTIRPGSMGADQQITSLGPLAELQVAFGESAFALLSTLSVHERSGAWGQRQLARITEVADLPTDWFGYEAVDVFVLSGTDRQLLGELSADKARFAALVRWIEQGGRLVILCGGADGRELLAEGGRLAPLIPGTFADVARLPETGPLENYARTDAPIAAVATRIPIAVPRLIDVTGSIEAYAGLRPADLPLVVRAPRGFGEIAFVGLDFTTAPLAEWEGRRPFLQAVLRPYQPGAELADGSEMLVTRGYDDLSGAVRQRLGRTFANVAPITFPLLALLALAYVLVLGPLDYLIIHRWLRRPLAAWITFPLAVLLFGIGAMALAEWRRGAGGPRVNQVELVDIDATSGLRRGTYWAALYSPSAEEFDLRLAVDPLARGAGAPYVLLSWWGLPGSGIGGMQARFTDLVNVRTGYAYVPADEGSPAAMAARGKMLRGVPLLTSSTKSFIARWTAHGEPLIAAQLTDQDGLATGYVENQTGRALRNARLLYNGWAYRLGHLEPGQRLEIGEELRPRSVKTLLTQDALGAAAAGISERTVFVPEQAGLPELLTLLMFHDAAGGVAFARLPSDYQEYCDLSRALALNQAVLVADVPGDGSRLLETQEGRMLGGDRDISLLIYRFVLPVANDHNTAP